VRAGLWHFSTGFQLLRWAAYLGVGAGGLAIVLFVVPRYRQGGVFVLLLGFLVGAMVAAVPLGLQKRARAAPPINDITTELDKASPLQAKAYPRIQPLEVEAPPAQAFAAALAMAREMGWEVVAEDAKAGTLAAVATTFWFGFKDDVEVRVTPRGKGSRIDVRSKSRVGRGDAGANASRVRSYLERLRQKT
jgi:uncharacterized protein (DUF1499 family)